MSAVALPLPPAPYSGLTLDRATERRTDAAWVRGLLADPRVRLRPFLDGDCLVTGDVPVVLGVDAAQALDGPEPVLLGLSDGVPEFAVDLTDLDRDDALMRAEATGTRSVRALYADLPAAEAGLLGYARGVLHWNRTNGFCGRCGAPTVSRNAGHLRVCTRCDHLIFPRIEPAIIVLIETTAEPRRILMARHRASTIGGFSLLAGFVEIGESLEDAVRREIGEEAGVTLDDVHYAGSQPFPFPAGLMLAFRATATDESVTVDGDEIVEARWFDHDELREQAAQGRLGRVDSIDRLLLGAWLARSRPL